MHFRKKILLSLAFTTMLFTVMIGQDTAHIKTILGALYPGDSLRIGTACHERYLGTQTETILNEEFDYVTPANDFKQSYIHPTPSTWKWERSDTWLNHTRIHSQDLRLHAPISPQVSTWAKDDVCTAAEL